MKLKPKRLKIVEQIIAVMILSVIVPLIITGIIINNINQQAIRRELGSSAKILAESVDNNLYDIFAANDSKLKEILVALKYIKSENARKHYLADFCEQSGIFSATEIKKSSENAPEFITEKFFRDSNSGKIKVVEKIPETDEYLVATIDFEKLRMKIFGNVNEKNRQIYVITEKRSPVLSLNGNKKDFEKLLTMLPPNIKNGDTQYFGNVENQPMVYRKAKNSNILILVNTTEALAQKTVYTAGFKIFLALLSSVLFGIIVTALYVSYLYINIRQLFKGISALSKGNYSRQIRLLKSVLTPYEIVFLATEFNKAAEEINRSYTLLAEQNRELSQVDEFRSNLIDTVSHEFRTPLTGIMGYTSRLMRKDIVLDEKTIEKSLQVIKRQSERLSRMVEDLLVIPDIEGARLNMDIRAINVREIVEFAVLMLKHADKHTIVRKFPNEPVFVKADKDRLEQVMINLLENANKYAFEDSSIEVFVHDSGKKVAIFVKNSSAHIKKEVLERLTEKFTRVDDKTTRTTGGTGLGLFIVKGLVEAMNGQFFIKSTRNDKFYSYVILDKADDEEIYV